MRPAKKRFLCGSVAQFQHLPILGLKLAADLASQMVRQNTVQALPVEIDDPPQIVQTISAGFPESLRNIAFVQFSITDYSNVASARGMSKMVPHVALRECPKDRG